MGESSGVTFVIVGASGDLASRKLFPALFALHARGLLPSDVRFVGFARTPMSDDDFRRRIADNLKCEELTAEACEAGRKDFLGRCFYRHGDYGDPGAFRGLQRDMEAFGNGDVNRVFYLAIPPSIFSLTARSLGESGMVRCGSCQPWSRVVIEKPFGRDRASSDRLTADIRGVFTEEQTFRIDHYLGKEVIQDLMVLRFANTIFEPVWNRHYVSHVHIAWSEDLALTGRAGYFDGFGIIRDVMQNHLTQMLALMAMECPWRMDAKCVRDEKVRLLRQVPPLRLENLVVGQYTAGRHGGRDVTGYRQEEGVPAGSRTPTYAAAVFEVKSPRWRGVPFLVSAGKGLDCQRTEIRIQFKSPEHDLFRDLLASAGASGTPLRDNELVIRVQPEEQIFERIVNKVPGMGVTLDSARLDLRYREVYTGTRIGDAYESLLLDVVRGDRSLFIRDDELEAAWDIFTPALQELETAGVVPEPYAFGSLGPAAVDDLAARFGIEDARVSEA